MKSGSGGAIHVFEVLLPPHSFSISPQKAVRQVPGCLVQGLPAMRALHCLGIGWVQWRPVVNVYDKEFEMNMRQFTCQEI